MKKLLFSLVLALAMTNLMAQSVGDYRTTASATSINSATGWERYDGTTWSTPTYAAGGNTITVKQASGWTSGSTSVSMAAPNSLVRVGQTVTATAGIPAGTKVTAVSGTSLTLSQPTTASAGSSTISFFEQTSSICSASISSLTLTTTSANFAVAPGMYAIATGITAGTTVSSVSTDGKTFTLSANTTAAISAASISFYTPGATATFTSGASTITLKEANGAVAVGMNIYGTTSIPAGTKVISVSGTTIGISSPTTSAQAGAVGITFGLNVIPNMYINHSINTGTNSRLSSIGNVYVNNSSSSNAGIGAVYTNATFSMGDASSNAEDFVCNTMTIAAGATLATNTNTNTKVNTLEINGGEGGVCLTNNGTIDLTTTTGNTNTTTVIFTTPGNTSINGSGSTYKFNNITLNMGGLLSNTIEVLSPITMATAAATPTLTLTSGTLKISSASTLTPFGGNCTSALNAVPALAGLYLNNASATLNWGTAVADGTGMQVRGALTLAAGTLYVKGRYDANGAGVTTISGGTLEIPSGITISSATAALFHMGGIHSFFMSGGNLNLKIHNAGGYSNPDYYNVATVQSLTGGNITFSDAAAMNSNTAKFYNLTVQNGGGAGTTLTRNSTATTILNNLTVGAGSTLENGTNNFLPNFTINGNTTTGSALVPLQSSGCVAIGQYLQGTGIPPNTTVTAITQTQTTGIVTSGSSSVIVPTNSGYTTGSMIFGSGIAAGTTVSNIVGSGPYTLTLSAAATTSSVTAEVLIINPVITMSNNATATSTPGQVNFYNATAFTNSGSGTINIQSTSNPAYAANTTWASTMNLNGSTSQNLLTGTYANVTLNNTAGANMQNGGTNLVTGVGFNGSSAINGTLTLTAGALTLNGKTLTLGGSSITRTSGTIAGASGTLTFTNASDITLPTGVFASNTINTYLKFNGAGAVTFPSDAITVASQTSNAITISLGSKLAVGATLTSAGNVSCLGTFQLNSGGYATGAGTWNYGISGTLAFNVSYGVDNAHVYWPTSFGPVNVSVLAGILTLNSGANRTVSGLFQTSDGVAFPSASLTLNGTAQINAGGYFSNAPTYGSSSILKYNNGSVYGRGTEWNSTNPASVQISNNSTLNYPNGSVVAAKSLTGSLTVDAGSSFYMDYGSVGQSNPLSVAGDVLLNGNLGLGGAIGGDLNVGGNWTRGASANLYPNSRAVFFNGTGTQTISHTGGEVFDYMGVNKASGTLSSADSIVVNNTLFLTSGKITLGANNLIIGATGTISGASSASYIVTDGTGKLKQTVGAGSATLFPIGSSISSYDPATLTPTTGTLISASVSGTLAYHNLSVPSSVYLNPREWTITPTAASSTVLALTPSALNMYVGLYGAMAGSEGYDVINSNYYYTSATKSGNTFTATYSDFTNPFATATADIAVALNDKAIAAKSGIYAANGKIFVNNANGKTIEVYALDGKKIRSVANSADNASIALEKGIYIISVDNVKSKVLVK